MSTLLEHPTTTMPTTLMALSQIALFAAKRCMAMVKVCNAEILSHSVAAICKGDAAQGIRQTC